jgi:hypothetical protein
MQAKKEKINWRRIFRKEEQLRYNKSITFGKFT